MANIRAHSCSLLTALWLLRKCAFLTGEVPAPLVAGSLFLLPSLEHGSVAFVTTLSMNGCPPSARAELDYSV